MTTLIDNSKTGPIDMVEFLFRYDDPELQEFYLDYGAVKEFPQEDAIFPNVYRNIGRFDFNDVENADEFYSFEFDEFGQTPYSNLIEHVPTGLVFAILPNEFPSPVFYYDDSKGWPTNIVLESCVDWKRVDTDAQGTRVGGTTDFSLAAWPHFNGCPLQFIAQYQLHDGRHIYIFEGEDNDSWLLEGGGNCALVEGGPIPSWIELKPVRESDEITILMRHPENAFTPVYPEYFNLPLPPVWIQGDETPNDVEYKFLMQFGDNTGDGSEDFSFGDSGDMYLFYKEETQEARVLWQCC